MKTMWAIALVIALAGCSGDGNDKAEENKTSKPTQSLTSTTATSTSTTPTATGKTTTRETQSSGKASSSPAAGTQQSPELKAAYAAAPEKRNTWQKTIIRQDCLKKKNFPMVADKNKPNSLQMKDFTGTPSGDFTTAWDACTKMHDLAAGSAPNATVNK